MHFSFCNGFCHQSKNGKDRLDGLPTLVDGGRRYYGGASASEIMAELQNGPVVVSLEPKSDLMYYQGGVYESTPDEVRRAHSYPAGGL